MGFSFELEKPIYPVLWVSTVEDITPPFGDIIEVSV